VQQAALVESRRIYSNDGRIALFAATAAAATAAVAAARGQAMREIRQAPERAGRKRTVQTRRDRSWNVHAEMDEMDQETRPRVSQRPENAHSSAQLLLRVRSGVGQHSHPHHQGVLYFCPSVTVPAFPSSQAPRFPSVFFPSPQWLAKHSRERRQRSPPTTRYKNPKTAQHTYARTYTHTHITHTSHAHHAHVTHTSRTHAREALRCVAEEQQGRCSRRTGASTGRQRGR